MLPDIILNQRRPQIVELAAEHRLPVVYPFREYGEARGLMFYGASFRDIYVPIYGLPAPLPDASTAILRLATSYSLRLSYDTR